MHAGCGVMPHRIDIAERPAIVAHKSRLGDWEGDAIVGAQPNGALLNHVEDKNLFTTIVRLPCPTVTSAHLASVPRLVLFSNHDHTITDGNGKEFAGHPATAQRLHALIFFATPYHVWVRGVHENTNGLIRDFSTNGSDFTAICPATAAKVERLLNRRPRKSLGFKTPNEVFHLSPNGGATVCTGKLNLRNLNSIFDV